jgi:hypothetical protein
MRSALTFVNRHVGMTLVCTLLAFESQAARPLQTDDAGVLEPRACEFELATQRLRVDGEHVNETGLGTGCGVGLNTQFNLAWSRERAGGEHVRLGAISGKTHLWRHSPEGAALALGYGVGALRDQGRWRQSERELTLIATVPLASLPALASPWAKPLVAHVNLGHVHEVSTRLATTTWGLALEHEGFELASLNWAPMGEFTGDDRDKPWFHLGLRVDLVAERFSVDASWGRQLGGTRAGLLSLGLKLSF